MTKARPRKALPVDPAQGSFFSPRKWPKEMMGTCGETGGSGAKKQRCFKGKRPRPGFTRRQGPGPEHQNAKERGWAHSTLGLQRQNLRSSERVVGRGQRTPGDSWSTHPSPWGPGPDSWSEARSCLRFPGSSTWRRGPMHVPPPSHSEPREGETHRWQGLKLPFIVHLTSRRPHRPKRSTAGWLSSWPAPPGCPPCSPRG